MALKLELHVLWSSHSPPVDMALYTALRSSVKIQETTEGSKEAVAVNLNGKPA